MAASTHWMATGTAQSVLERGGNAFDAAVAAAFVLHVVEPHLNGPGGDLVAIVAPAGAEPPGCSTGRALPRGGEHRALHRARARPRCRVPGRWPPRSRVRSRPGCSCSPSTAPGSWETCWPTRCTTPSAGTRPGCRCAAWWRPWPSCSTRTGRPPRHAGCPAVARRSRGRRSRTRSTPAPCAGSWRAAENGSRTERITSGRTRLAVRVRRAGRRRVRPHARTGTPPAAGTPGVLTVGDLERFRPSWEPPVLLEFRGATVAEAWLLDAGPGAAAGPGHARPFDDDRLDPSTGVGAHTILEVLKLALADRDGLYGDDGDGASCRPARTGYAVERAALIGDTASGEFRPGSRRGCGRTGHRCGGPRGTSGTPAGSARRADRVLERPHPGRHLPPRRGRPLREHDLRDAVRRLAAVLADRARAGLLPRHPATDDLAGPAPARPPCAPGADRAPR